MNKNEESFHIKCGIPHCKNEYRLYNSLYKNVWNKHMAFLSMPANEVTEEIGIDFDFVLQPVTDPPGPLITNEVGDLFCFSGCPCAQDTPAIHQTRSRSTEYFLVGPSQTSACPLGNQFCTRVPLFCRNYSQNLRLLTAFLLCYGSHLNSFNCRCSLSRHHMQKVKISNVIRSE